MTVATMVNDPLAAILATLEPRQVANDEIDRDAWLRARLRGITATEAKILHIGSNREKADVIKKKIEGDTFTGNKYTDWGSFREGALLDLAGARKYGWLVHADGNPRHMATPDGLVPTWGGFAVVECKTSKYPIGLGSERFNNYGYLWQMVWQMYCAGASEAFYVWEQHDDDWSRWDARPRDNESVWHEFGPQPVESRVEHIMLTPELVEQMQKMVAAADRALTRLDKRVAEARAEIAEPVEPPAEAVQATKALETQGIIYLNALDEEKAAGQRKKDALAGALDMSVKRWGDDTNEHVFTSLAGETVRIGYSPAGEKQTSVPDEVAAREADPELWERREHARVLFEQVDDQWQAHASSHMATQVKATPASVRVTKRKGKE